MGSNGESQFENERGRSIRLSMPVSLLLLEVRSQHTYNVTHGRMYMYQIQYNVNGNSTQCTALCTRVFFIHSLFRNCDIDSARVLPMQSRRYFKPSIGTKIIVCQQVFASLPRKWSMTIYMYYLVLSLFYTPCLAGVLQVVV